MVIFFYGIILRDVRIWCSVIVRCWWSAKTCTRTVIVLFFFALYYWNLWGGGRDERAGGFKSKCRALGGVWALRKHLKPMWQQQQQQEKKRNSQHWSNNGLSIYIEDKQLATVVLKRLCTWPLRQSQSQSQSQNCNLLIIPEPRFTPNPVQKVQNKLWGYRAENTLPVWCQLDGILWDFTLSELSVFIPT